LAMRTEPPHRDKALALMKKILFPQNP